MEWIICLSQSIARRFEDLAARNVLLCDDNDVKICDFGLDLSLYKKLELSLSYQYQGKISENMINAHESHRVLSKSLAWNAIQAIRSRVDKRLCV